MGHQALTIALVAVLCSAAPPRKGFAQAPTTETTFEVVSVRKAEDPNLIYGIRPVDPSRRFHAIITVYDLILIAYGSPLALLDAQIIGAPAWTRSDRFEIVHHRFERRCLQRSAQFQRAFVIGRDVIAEPFGQRAVLDHNVPLAVTRGAGNARIVQPVLRNQRLAGSLPIR